MSWLRKTSSRPGSLALPEVSLPRRAKLDKHERRARRVARIAVSTFRYESLAGAEDGTAAADSRDRSNSRGRFGYRNPSAAESRGLESGEEAGVGCTGRKGLTLRHKPRRKRRASLHRHERFRPTGANQVWSLDFVADQLADGRRFRALTILDVFTRESLAIEVGQKLKGSGCQK